MKVRLHYYRDPVGNFGDDLNPWLWPRLLPGVIDLKVQAGEADVTLIGIGTILGDHLAQLEGRKVVIGSGFGYRGKPPQLGPDWTVLCVRGPLTAAAMGLPHSAAVTDAAVLIRSFVEPRVESATDIGFMPHHRSAQSGAWEEVVKSAGLEYLCPHASVGETLDRMRHLRLLVAEAMHGAIVADILRIPWIPVRAAPWILDFKWRDWCASMEIEHRFERLLPFPWRPGTSGTWLRRRLRSLRTHLTTKRLVPQARSSGPVEGRVNRYGWHGAPTHKTRASRPQRGYSH